MVSINPATGEAVREYPCMGEPEVARAVANAQHEFEDWRRRSFAYRASLMCEAARILRADAARLAVLMAEEMGKPVRDGRGEAEKCAWVCEYYAENAERFLAPEPVETDAAESFVSFQPLGVVLAIMPWNFPFWQVFRFAAPSLMAGNAALLKHASNVPGCALAIEQVFREAGFPEGLFGALLIGSAEVGRVVDDPAVQAVTLTGSTPAGMEVAARAGRALKKTVLELGGSDPYIILDDADPPAAARICVTSRLINAGQSCIAAKRFIVVESVCEAFISEVLARMRAVTWGDPLDEATALGPMARHDLRDELHRQVEDSIVQGAKCLLGGEIPQGPGAFYPPTLLVGVRPGMRAHDEELFGPVAVIISVADEAEAIDVANDTPFGLGAAVFTADLPRGRRIAEEDLHAGACFVNSFVKSDPRLPFGGIKQSGYGRELSRYGIREFVNVKTVYLA